MIARMLFTLSMFTTLALAVPTSMLLTREDAPTDTDLFRNGKSEQLIQYFRNLHPMKRIGEVDEISPIVAFLSREEAGWVNGQTHFVNGVSCFVGLYAYRR